MRLRKRTKKRGGGKCEVRWDWLEGVVLEEIRWWESFVRHLSIGFITYPINLIAIL